MVVLLFLFMMMICIVLKKEEWNGKCLINFNEEDLKKLGIPRYVIFDDS